jgi:prepilin-type processing-associated H-X9-DG protein
MAGNNNRSAGRAVRARAGITLVELLVVIAILALLFGLMVPAIQKVRAAAANAQCANNLRQNGVALHNAHGGNGPFPSGMYGGPADANHLFMASWMLAVIPYLEHDNIYREARADYRNQPQPLRPIPHIHLKTVVKVFTCPADPRVDRAQFAPRDAVLVGLTSYLGVSGTNTLATDGMFFTDSQIGLRDITDGTSNTLMVGERPPSTDFQFGWWYAGAGQLFTGSADMVLGVRETNFSPFSLVPCPSGVYQYTPGRLDNQCDMFHFWSLHPGGANFLFCDASVHFLPYSANPIMPALASRSGGEAVSWTD